MNGHGGPNPPESAAIAAESADFSALVTVRTVHSGVRFDGDDQRPKGTTVRVILRCDDPAAIDHDLFGHFATVSMGAPGRCPECDAFGFIERADLAHRSQTQRCRSCGYGWSYQFDPEGALVEVIELCAARRPRRDATGPQQRPDLVDLTSDLAGVAAAPTGGQHP